MNVKFFEHLPYYTKTNLEGENVRQSQAKFWDLSIHVLPSPVESEPLTLSNENVPKTTTTTDLSKAFAPGKELQVYSR